MLSRNHVTLLLIALVCYLIHAACPLAFADPPTINGPSGMPVSTTRDLSVSGGTGPYTWSMVNGAGNLTGSGDAVSYSALDTNPNCQNNPTICVTDATGQRACKQIAVNAYINPTYIAGQERTDEEIRCTPWDGIECNCTRLCPTFNCAGDRLTLGRCSGGSGGTILYCTASKNPCVCQPTCTPVKEISTQAAFAGSGGCCPPQMYSSATGTATQSHDAGNSCYRASMPANSKANVKSGNLFYEQVVGGLTLTYNSIHSISGSLGGKWTHPYNIRITSLSSNTILRLDTEDGDFYIFRLSGGVYYPEAITGDASQIVRNANGTYTQTRKDGTVYSFNSGGKLTGIQDRNGRTTALTYSGSNLTGITDFNGRTTTITNTSNRITGITDAMGRTYTLAYTSGYLTSITDPLNNVWRYTYDTNGHMLTRTDPAGRQYAHTYSSIGLLMSATDPEGKTRTMTYPQNGLTTQTEKDGGVWTYKYDPIFTVKTEVTDPRGNTVKYAYDTRRNLIKKTEADNSFTAYTYDANNNLLTETDPLGKTTTYTYNALNLVTSITDPKGNITQYGYDTNGNLTSVTAPGNAITQYGYDTRGNITSITDPRNKVTTMTYDARNNLLTVTDPQNHTTTMTYDDMGNMLTRTDALNHTTTFEYNVLNQLTRVTDPRGNVTQHTYDFADNRLSTTDANSNVTQYLYNFKNQLTRITDALNYVTNLSYSGSGCASCNTGVEKLISVVDAKSQTTSFEYDQTNNLTKETDSLAKVTTYTYDAKGNRLTRNSPDNKTITYTYDLNNRLTQKQYSGGAITTFQYDDNGNITYAANPNISYTFTYDANNRLTGVTDSLSRTITYQYDAAGNRTSMTSPENLTTTYTYNDANRLSGISNFAGSFGLTYDNAGRRTQLTYPNGTTAAYTYDANDNLTQIRHTDSGNVVLSETNYTYNNINNRITKNTANYTYDTISRLMNTTGEDYTYDGVGNRLTGPLTTDTMSYNAGNQQLNINTTQFAYDFNGNRTQKTEGGITTTYTYDDENKLIQVTKGSDSITYAYDPFGRRITKNVNGVITRLVYDQNEILAAYDGSGNVTARYAHGLNIDEHLAVQQDTTASFYHADGLGSIVALTNTAGAVVQTYSYDSFGNVTPTGTITQPYAFTGREYDYETGLYFYHARYYDPKAGRFVMKDPIGFDGGDVNLYGYVGSNPVNFTDSLGLRPLTDTEKGYLSPYIPQRDLNNADVHVGEMPWYAPSWAAGITRGNEIYIRDPNQTFNTPSGMNLIGHEIVHVGQYADGMTWLSYLWANRNGYDKNPYEIEAYKVGNKIYSDLTQQYGDHLPCLK